MKIENKEMLLYSMDKAVNGAIKALRGEDEKEVFYHVGSAIHWIVDCYDRIKVVNGLSPDNEKMLSALHCTNNALKHCVDFLKPHEREYGIDFPFDFPMEFSMFYVWKDLSNVNLRHDNQKEAYQRLLRGKHIENTLKETRKELYILFENV